MLTLTMVFLVVAPLTVSLSKPPMPLSLQVFSILVLPIMEQQGQERNRMRWTNIMVKAATKVASQVQAGLGQTRMTRRRKKNRRGVDRRGSLGKMGTKGNRRVDKRGSLGKMGTKGNRRVDNSAMVVVRTMVSRMMVEKFQKMMPRM